MSIERINKTEELLNAFLEVKFQNYVELQDFIELHIKKVQEELDIKWDEMENVELHEFYEHAEKNGINDLLKFDYELPNKVRYSAIVQSFSMLEFYMKWLCDRISIIKDSKFKSSDLKGNSDLEKGKLYIFRLYQIDLKSFEPEWNFINDMRIIRNQIIHKNGEFNSNELEIIKLITKYDELGIMYDGIRSKTEDQEIEIKSKMLNENFIGSIKSMFLKLLQEIKRKEQDIA